MQAKVQNRAEMMVRFTFSPRVELAFGRHRVAERGTRSGRDSHDLRVLRNKAVFSSPIT